MQVAVERLQYRNARMALLNVLTDIRHAVLKARTIHRGMYGQPAWDAAFLEGVLNQVALILSELVERGPSSKSLLYSLIDSLSHAKNQARSIPPDLEYMVDGIITGLGYVMSLVGDDDLAIVDKELRDRILKKAVDYANKVTGG